MANPVLTKSETSVLPVSTAPRSYVRTNPKHLTTLNASYLVPLRAFKVMPNGMYKFNIGTILRMFALKNPIFGDLYLEVFAHYVPYALLMKKWPKAITTGHDNEFDEDLFGNLANAGVPSNVGKPITPDLFIPHLESKGDGFEVHSMDLLNYLGCRIANRKKAAELKKLKAQGQKVQQIPEYIRNSARLSALPLRAYNLIWSSDFRSEFLLNPLKIDFDSDVSDPTEYTLQRVCRSKDFFSNGFVSSQLNADIFISFDNRAEIEGDNGQINLSTVLGSDAVSLFPNGELSFLLRDNNGGTNEFIGIPNFVANASSNFQTDSGRNMHYTSANNEVPFLASIYNPTGTPIFQYSPGGSMNTQAHFQIFYNNGLRSSVDNPRGYGNLDPMDIAKHLQVKLNSATELSINQLRNLIALQHISERMLYGTSLEQLLNSSFGLNIPQVKLDRPLLFGYKKVPISISQVVQTAPSTDGSSAVGEVAGMSCTVAKLSDENFTFTSYDYGLVMITCVIRHKSIYCQGIDPIFFEKDKFSYYWPEFAGLSNIPVPKKSIFYTGDDVIDDSTFNFAEYGAEYFNDGDYISGDFSPDSDYPMTDFHLGDIYESAPNFDNQWILDTTKECLDRGIALNSNNAPQFYGIFSINYERYLPVRRGVLGSMTI